MKNKNTHVIHNGIDINLFKKSNEPKVPFRIGFVGFLNDVKRVYLLPGIVDEIQKKVPQVSLVLIGDGPNEIQLKLACKEKKHIIFKGRLEPKEVASELQKINVLLLPSKSEGSPLVIKEAHAMGVPVVATNTGGLPESVGNGGFLIDDGPQFITDFATAVIELLLNPISDKQLICDRQTTWTNVVQQEVSLYQNSI